MRELKRLFKIERIDYKRKKHNMSVRKPERKCKDKMMIISMKMMKLRYRDRNQQEKPLNIN